MATPSKIVGSFWFTEHSGRSFGIVKVHTSDGYRFYIGHAQGNDEKDDARHISRYGSPLNNEQVKEFISTAPGSRQDPYRPKQEKNTTKYHTEILAAMSIGIGLGLALATVIL